jgi:hypothetical protein
MSKSDSLSSAAKNTNELKKQQQREQCNKFVHTGLTRNVKIRFLLESLMAMGCTPPKHFIRCMDCGKKQAGGGFGIVEISRENDRNNINQKPSGIKENIQCKQTLERIQKNTFTSKDIKKIIPGIFLCEKNLRNETHVHQSLSHEIIHAIDFCRSKMDPLNNCLHVACTEIRAENLSGECDFINEFT